MIEHRALFWEKKEKGKIQCLLCPHYCSISPSHYGICRTRYHNGEELIAKNYGRITSIAVDPIEKKPLYHFYPGSNILSIGTYGCNMSCLFCQNHSISQQEIKTHQYKPEDILHLLDKTKDNIGLAFTYNEPLVWFEFIYDTAKLVKEKKKETKIAVITNGYINPKPFELLLPYIDAMNIDLKTFENTTYKKLCKASLEPVIESIKKAANNCHLEITNLMITDENDSLEEIEKIAIFLSEIDRDIPLHLSRYYPNYQFTKQATSIERILEAKTYAQKYLNYVYVGNIANCDANTYCPKCNELLIERRYYQVKKYLKTKFCPKCNTKLPINA
jgi:pyruvate formate lyase activating enzyme